MITSFSWLIFYSWSYVTNFYYLSLKILSYMNQSNDSIIRNAIHNNSQTSSDQIRIFVLTSRWTELRQCLKSTSTPCIVCLLLHSLILSMLFQCVCYRIGILLVASIFAIILTQSFHWWFFADYRQDLIKRNVDVLGMNVICARHLSQPEKLIWKVICEVIAEKSHIVLNVSNKNITWILIIINYNWILSQKLKRNEQRKKFIWILQHKYTSIQFLVQFGFILPPKTLLRLLN